MFVSGLTSLALFYIILYKSIENSIPALIYIDDDFEKPTASKSLLPACVLAVARIIASRIIHNLTPHAFLLPVSTSAAR